MAIIQDDDNGNAKKDQIGAIIFILILIGFMFFVFKKLTKRKK